MSKHIVSAFSYPLESDDLIKNCKKIAEREEKTLSKIILELLADYAKKHGDGNPAFTLDQFQDKNFRACPAFYRENKDWYSYLMSLSKQDFNSAWQQKNTILSAFDKADRDRLK
jgi:hypothetical protein